MTATAETTDWTRIEVLELLTMNKRMCANYDQKPISMKGRNVLRLIAFTLPLMMMVVPLQPKMLTD